MRMCDLQSESSDACLLLWLPEDVFAVISRFLSPIDVCNLSLCCKSLRDLVDSEKIWLSQCEVVNILPLFELVEWRIGISSYKALCRFLVQVMKPLVGIWVHQNPELGNVVYVMPGFLSVVGCRIIPQEVDPLGKIRVMWSPVFEIICGLDGSMKFFLHGRDRERNLVYPGFIMGIERSCNVLLLEVEPRRESEVESKEVRFPFCKLAFSDRRKLLEEVTGYVGLALPDDQASGSLLFPRSKDDKAILLERRIMLLKMHKFGGNWKHMNLEDDELGNFPIQVDIKELWKNLGYEDDESQIQTKKSFSNYLRNSVKHILGKSSKNKSCSSSSEIRRLNLQTFLSSGDSISLSLKASQTKLSFYRGWPDMHETRYALYKLPVRDNQEEEYAGLWGGTFGWPPGNCSEEKPGKAFFLLMLTYEKSQDDDSGERLLIGTKILEGTHYVMHPNGSAMFVIKIDSPPSSELFPFDDDTEDFEYSSYTGEGISKGYGFRYPGYKPGSLFVTSNGLLMFVWKETRVVLTLQRLNLEELLKKGICVPPLPPSLNFTYLTKSHTNVFAPGRGGTS